MCIGHKEPHIYDAVTTPVPWGCQSAQTSGFNRRVRKAALILNFGEECVNLIGQVWLCCYCGDKRRS